MRSWSVVVAGGAGDRFGGPKQWMPLAGRRVVDWSVDAARTGADGVVLVVPPADVGRVDLPRVDAVVPGGSSRSASVRAGLDAVPADADIVVVHDAARPLAAPELFTAVVAAISGGAAAAVCAVPVADTLKRVVEGAVVATVPRDGLWAVQTPQAFRAGLLRHAHEGAPEATDDAGLVEAMGEVVAVVPGDRRNIKITDPVDLRLAGSPARMRIGQGFDVHAFSDDPARPLVLAGVRFDGEPGLAGHSDADAVAHAVIDALLGAAGLGDIGSWFPDDDPALAGADSIGLLRRAVEAVTAAGWRVENVDCTVVCERPKIAPHREAMQQHLAAVVGAPVMVKGKRAEGLGALGRTEGIACLAVALLVEG